MKNEIEPKVEKQPAKFHTIRRQSDPECTFCQEEAKRGNTFFPPHDACDFCESGKYNHCSCDWCF